MIGTAETLVKWLFNQKRDKLFEIKEHRAKRTLTQNAYYWVLVNELANCLRKSKEEVHFDLLRDYSQVALVILKNNVNIKGYIRYYEFERETIISNVKFNIYKVYKGSSEMDKKEFSILLEGLIQEAQQQGIPTLTPNEIAKLRYIENDSNRPK